MKSFRIALCVAVGLAAGCVSPRAGTDLRGMWLTATKDPTNRSRADVSGRMHEAPQEVWSITIGGAVGFAREVTVGGAVAVLAQVGTNLQLTRPDGRMLWRLTRLGVGEVMRVDDFDGDGDHEILVRTDPRTVVLLDLATGTRLWSWQSEPSTQIVSRAFIKTERGLRFVTFPNYSHNGYCFDFSGDASQPRRHWERNFEGKYGAGFGPSIVLKDMDADGADDIVLSGKVPSVYQAVIDAETGAIKVDGHIDVEGWGRPYGYLHARDLDSDGRPEVIMVSCQVEEYLAVARNVPGGGLEKVWSHFVEKDWPHDEKELRPQVTSVADVQGDGKPELIVGYWDGQWSTLILDPLVGFAQPRARLVEHYFWGCLDIDGDGKPEIVTSFESDRAPARTTTLQALEGKSLEPIATLEDAAVFTSGDSPLPPDTFFMASRRNPLAVKLGDGTSGILVRLFPGLPEEGLFLWGGRAGTAPHLRRVAGAEFQRANLHAGRLLLSDGQGRIQRFGVDLQPLGDILATTGVATRPLVCEVDGRRELVFATVGGEIRGGTVDLERSGRLAPEWQVRGQRPALHVDGQGRRSLVAAGTTISGDAAVLVYTGRITSESEPVQIPLRHPIHFAAGILPFGDAELRILVTMETGVHTRALVCFDSQGEMLWEDKGSGAHVKSPAAADVDGDGLFELAVDDHGALRLYDDDGTVLAKHEKNILYTLPILGPFSLNGESLILRASGYNGIGLADLDAGTRWHIDGAGGRYYQSRAAVGDVSGDGRLMMGALLEGGEFECIDPLTGIPRWSVALGEPANGTSVVAGDLDGDGNDEFLVGLVTGKLIALGEDGGEGRVLWEKELPASIYHPIIADVDGDGFAEIVLSTADGAVRILKEK